MIDCSFHLGPHMGFWVLVNEPKKHYQKMAQLSTSDEVESSAVCLLLSSWLTLLLWNIKTAAPCNEQLPGFRVIKVHWHTIMETQSKHQFYLQKDYHVPLPRLRPTRQPPLPPGLVPWERPANALFTSCLEPRPFPRPLFTAVAPLPFNVGAARLFLHS